MRSGSLRRRATRLCATLAVAAAALMCPQPSQAAEKALSVDLSWGIPSSAFEPTREAIADTKASWVRIEIRWNEAEPSSKGSYDKNVIARYDRAVDTALAAGAKVLAFVHQTPGWASGSRNRMWMPRNPADYADFVRFLAQRYAGRVSAWEVWNEQNTSRFWPSGPNPSAYVPLLKAAYPAVKAADPNALVVFGGLSQNDHAYVEGAYAAGAQGYFDVMAVHPYPGANPPEHVWYWDGRIGPSAFTGFEEVRKSMLARGDDKPIWLTEFGWSTTTTEAWGVTPAQQADYLTRAYRVLEQYPYVEQAYWYNLRNNFWNYDADTWETQLGLLRTDFTHKPSYEAFKSYEPGTLPPDAGAPSPAPPSAPSPTEPDRQSQNRAASRRATRTFIKVMRGGPARRSARAASLGLAHAILVSGRVAGASDGKVELRLFRRGPHGRWKALRTRLMRVGEGGSFRLELGIKRDHWLRAQAFYGGSDRAAPSRSRALRVRS